MKNLEEEKNQSGIKALEAAVGHAFRAPALLRQALTHPSMGHQHNQRLEFLGDAVLELCVSEKIYEKHPEMKAMPWKLERKLENEAEEEWISEHPGKWPWDSENMTEFEQYTRDYRNAHKIKEYEKEIKQ